VVLNRPDNAEHLANSIQLAAMRAQALANSNRGEEAANLFTNLLRRTDNPAELSIIISRIARSVMRDRAAEIVDAAIPAERMSPAIDLQLALIAQGRRDWETVIQRLTKYEDESSDSGNLMYQVHLSLALAYQESGGQDNLLRAKSIYEAMLVTYGDNVELLNNLAYLLTDHLLGTNHAQAAVDYAERAIALLSPSAPRLQKAMLYDTLGWAQFKAGDLDAARASLRESIAFSPLAVNHKHLGLVHMAAGDKTLAISSMSQARSAARAANDTEQEQEIQGYLEQLRSQ
jgi:tetratricopeptide (TPR) repeat protein